MEDWLDVGKHPVGKLPLSRSDAEMFYANFCKRLRRSGPKEGRRIITRLQWQSSTMVSPDIFRHPLLAEASRLYLVSDGMQPSVWLTDAATILDYFQRTHWEDDLHIVDDSLDWCLAITHDDHLELYDPLKRFGL